MGSEYWLTLGLAAVLGALIGAATTAWSVTRNIKHKSVTEERQHWRGMLRELVPELVSSKDKKSRIIVRNAIALRLNPYQDEELLATLDTYLKNPSITHGEQVVEHFQALLKFDWERAKIEASFVPWCASWRARKRIQRQKRHQLLRNDSEQLSAASSVQA